MSAEQTISERIEAVLWSHGEVWGDLAMHGWECRCGWPRDLHTRYDEAAYRAHVTAALLAAGIMQEVRAEALREAADEMVGPHGTSPHAQFLRDRADSIVQGRRDGGGV